MLKKIPLFFSLFLSLLFLGTLAVFSISQVTEAESLGIPQEVRETIQKGFDTIRSKLDLLGLKKDQILVHGGGIEIPLERFVFYRENVDLISQLGPYAQPKLSDEAILDNMIKDELAVQYAKALGLNVSPQEVDDVVQLQRSLLEQTDDQNGYVIKELMANRIKITGLTEDQFWNSSEVREMYEKALLRSKLANKLVEEGTIKDVMDFTRFKENLYAEKKGDLHINYSLLQ